MKRWRMTKMQKMCFVFIIGCLFGYYYEVILNCVVSLVETGEWFIERRSGVIYGPFSIIYGLGAVLMAAPLAEKKLKIWQLFIYGGLICGVCEYFVGWLQQTFTGTVSWDYSDHFFNIGGKTSLEIMAVWGLICVGYVGVIYPLAIKLAERIPEEVGVKILYVTMAFLILDMAVSFSAVVKMNLRHMHVPTYTAYGKVLDEIYPDERVLEAYPNMEWLDE